QGGDFMTSFTTFYLSRITGSRVYDANNNLVGIIKDLFILPNYISEGIERPLVAAVKLKKGKITSIYSFTGFAVKKIDGKISVTCNELIPFTEEKLDEGIFLAEGIQDKQIVDLNGRKLVRVNDIRLVSVPTGTFALAVDIGLEGLLRRISLAKPLKKFLLLFRVTIPAKFIVWDDIEAVDFSNFNIKLSKSHKKLETLHPSDLADIIEDMGKQSRISVFEALDEEKAADVMEELEVEAQIHLLENLSVAKAADVLEKMPADEVADILDELEEEKAEQILREMEKDSSEEVRELLEYPDDSVGSIMSTEYLSFSKDNTVEEVFVELRTKKPEAAELYNLFVVNDKEKLIATFSLRDLVVSEPTTTISQIMKPSPVHLHDNQEINEIAEFISKYNLLAIPVVNKDNILQGMVVIDDVVEDLIGKRKTNK
ncbi:MAG: CBS domain-containing protein, partial [Bacteroidota bacterium]|nr:CBS domain-containing protein [Bacteroidota bacterium]